MKYVVAFIIMVSSAWAKAQTFACKESENYTCYHLDSTNVHCFKEDSNSDLDLDNDGLLDREYIFSTPRKGDSIHNKSRLDKQRGTIRKKDYGEGEQ